MRSPCGLAACPSAGWDRNTGDIAAVLEAERAILGKDKGAG